MTALPDSPITSDLRQRIDPTDPRFYLVINLLDVQSGKKSRAPGIRRCKDCDTAYIDHNTGLHYCPNCRTDHQRSCQQCQQLIPNTTAGDRLCASCTNQPHSSKEHPPWTPTRPWPTSAPSSSK